MQPLHHFPELAGPVAAGHPSENLVIPTLQGQVDMAAEARRVTHESNHFRFHLVGMKRTQAKARHCCVLEKASDEGRQRDLGPEVPAIRPQVYPGKHNLGMARSRQALCLCHHVIRMETAIRTPDRRNDAEGAGKVTAILNLQEEASSIRPLRRRCTVKGPDFTDVTDRDQGLAPLFTAYTRPEKPRTGKTRLPAVAIWSVVPGRQVLGLPGRTPEMAHQLHLLGVAQDQIDTFNGGDPFGRSLGVTAGHHHKGHGISADSLADEAASIGICPLGHRAGIDHVDLG